APGIAPPLPVRPPPHASGARPAGVGPPRARRPHGARIDTPRPADNPRPAHLLPHRRQSLLCFLVVSRYGRGCRAVAPLATASHNAAARRDVHTLRPARVAGPAKGESRMVRTDAGDRMRRSSLRRVKLIHCYTTPWADVPDGTPAPLMIATLDLATSRENVFALHLVAERRGIPPIEIPGRRQELEREVWEEFYGLVRSAKNWRWVHWNMVSVVYGFPALAHRLQALGGTPAEIPQHRVINLAEALKRAFGDDYVPHPRLENLIRLNDLSE